MECTCIDTVLVAQLSGTTYEHLYQHFIVEFDMKNIKKIVIKSLENCSNVS